jgi:CheY-like chemotaxis protein/anti-sigma regulatory factor (Ser/Thr protein kinase)
MASPASPSPAVNRPFVLVVDDDRFTRMMLCNTLESLGYLAVEAPSGKEALNIIQQSWRQLDAILLDRMMPGMGGMEVVARIKESRELNWLPIIMQTGADSQKEIQEGLEAGVFYYFTKPVDVEILKSVIEVASREAQHHRQLLKELEHRRESFQLIESCSCFVRTIAEAESCAGLLANCFPDPARVISGLAELLYNAVEHGNLGITYDQKTTLVSRGVWADEVARRVELPENRNKRAGAFFVRTQEGSSVTIKDYGEGFEWRKYLQVDPSRAHDNHGRGIAQANMMSFDKLTYNEAGNEVTAFCAYQRMPE